MPRGTHEILIGDVRDRLQDLPDGHFHTCCTSPPYFGLRDYQVAGQIGSEPTPDVFIQTMVDVFREVRRVLRPDSTLWLNLGDSYSGGGRGNYDTTSSNKGNAASRGLGRPAVDGYKPGDLLNIPHRVASALQADGWYWRSTIIWSKRSPMPESISGWRWVPCRVKVAPQENGTQSRAGRTTAKARDCVGGEWIGSATWQPCPGCAKCSPNGGYILRKGRWRPTNATEYIFLMTPGERYFCDGDAVQEMATHGARGSRFDQGKSALCKSNNVQEGYRDGGTRNPRNVWTLSSEPYKGAHFATFPSEIPRRAILAGTSAAGCCSACGSPLAPVVETERIATRPGLANVLDPSGMSNRDPQRHVAASKITGYRPTCKCFTQAVPCRVLEPFCGSGTTLQTAVWLGRDATGIELNPDYAAMAETRIASPPRFAKPQAKPRPKIVQCARQIPLFG